jgi:hypothetical protein
MLSDDEAERAPGSGDFSGSRRSYEEGKGARRRCVGGGSGTSGEGAKRGGRGRHGHGGPLFQRGAVTGEEGGGPGARVLHDERRGSGG